MKAIKQYFNGLTFLPIIMIVYTVGMVALLAECYFFYAYSNIPLTVLTVASLIFTLLYGYNPKKWINTVQLVLLTAFFITLFFSSFENIQCLACALILLSVSYMVVLYIEHTNYSF